MAAAALPPPSRMNPTDSLFCFELHARVEAALFLPAALHFLFPPLAAARGLSSRLKPF
jgi:hypothetical protein